jgi:hypothetical protein
MTAPTTTEIAARDGLHHTPSTQPAVHRPLVVVDPPMEGRDVSELQHAVRERLVARGLDKHVMTPDHGKFTKATALACIEAEHFLGLRSDTYLLKDKHGHRIVTEGAQRIIREPETRDEVQLKRAKERREHMERSRKLLAAKLDGDGVGGGVAAALAFAEKQVGIKEDPPGSNSGPRIDQWCHAAGYKSPVPWCGCFVNACLMAGGLPSGAGWIGYTPAIRRHAIDKKDGWSFHTMGMPGDLALYDDHPGGDPVVHVEIVRKRLSDTRYSTYGGNTSSGNGSPSDGGMVARHDNRMTTGGFHIIGFARPPWKA